MSSSVHANNKNKNILILHKGQTKGIDNTSLTSEPEYSINFSRSERKLCLCIHYNGSFLFFKGCICYFFASLFLDLNESTCQVKKNVFISLQNLFSFSRKSNFDILHFQIS